MMNQTAAPQAVNGLQAEGIRVEGIATAAPTRWTSRIADFASLIKPRIVVMELITVAIALHVASEGVTESLAFWAALAGAGLLGGSANALNMWIEQPADAVMRRTRGRPLPSGRLTAAEVIGFAAVTLVLGTALLGTLVNVTTMLLGVGCWFSYVAVYTPMKKRSAWNTTVGAVAGSLPIVMGWTAGGGSLDLTALGLFGVLFFWQYPHFMAIAWMYRNDYLLVNYHMSTTVDPSGKQAGVQAVLGSLALWGVSLVPAVEHFVPYSVACTVLALLMLVPSLAFWRNPNDLSARRLLRASLVYLPLWLWAFWFWA